MYFMQTQCNCTCMTDKYFRKHISFVAHLYYQSISAENIGVLPCCLFLQVPETDIVFIQHASLKLKRSHSTKEAKQ